MTAWRHSTPDQLTARGLKFRGSSSASRPPARARTADRPVPTGRGKRTHLLITKQPQVTMPVLKNILGVALQDAFPGVFVPIEARGIHWGSEARRVGVNVGGWCVAGVERDGWVVVPCLPRAVMEDMGGILKQVRALF